MLDDKQLLRRYVAESSDVAFGELVARYVNLVYCAALRRTGGDAHLAQDVAQLVFTDLARKARTLPDGVVLAGWLHRATHFACAQLLRTERRRVAREQEAVTMNSVESEATPEWEQIRPLLDDALDRLGRNDRDALLLRFFEQRSLAEVGQLLGSNEEAARKRVARALEKLRAELIRRGVTTTGAALSTVLSVNAAQVAPAGLAATLTSASLATAAVGSGSTLTLLKFVTMTKLKAGMLGAIVVASVATSLVIHNQTQSKLHGQDESLRQQSEQLAQLQADNERLANLLGQAGNSRPNNLDVLLRLRGEAESLRKVTNDLTRLREENRHLLQRPDAKTKTPLEIKEETLAKVNFSKDWLIAFRIYASEHQEQLPTSFDQALPFLPREFKGETNVTGDQFEIVYQGSLAALTNWNVIILREREQWLNSNGKWTRIYGMLDGSVTTLSVPVLWTDTGGKQISYESFELWEKEHMIPPARQ